MIGSAQKRNLINYLKRVGVNPSFWGPQRKHPFYFLKPPDLISEILKLPLLRDINKLFLETCVNTEIDSTTPS